MSGCHGDDVTRNDTRNLDGRQHGRMKRQPVIGIRDALPEQIPSPVERVGQADDRFLAPSTKYDR